MAVHGSLDDIDIVNLIEVARQSLETVRLDISTATRHFAVYVHQGEIVHAENGKTRGEAVFYELLNCKQGTFAMEKGGALPEVKTIHSAWNTLLLQGLQQLDHERELHNSQEDTKMAMAPKERMEDVLREMANDMEPGLLGIAVAGTDGMGLAFHKIAGDSAESLGSQVALIMQLSRRSTQRIENSDVEDVLVTSDKSYLLGRFLGEGAYFAAVRVERDSVLGNTRLTMRNYADRLLKAIPSAK